MTTSNPNVTPPAGGGEPDPDRQGAGNSGAGPDPHLSDRLEGAVPTSDDPETPEAGSSPTDPDSDVDSTEADRRRSGG